MKRKKKIRVKRHKRKKRSGGSSIVRSHLRKLKQPISLDDSGKIIKPEDFPLRICRECYRCRKEMPYTEFLQANLGLYDYRWLKRIWRDPRIELYCCTCKRIIESEAKKKKKIDKRIYDRAIEQLLFIENIPEEKIAIIEQLGRIYAIALKDFEGTYYIAPEDLLIPVALHSYHQDIWENYLDYEKIRKETPSFLESFADSNPEIFVKKEEIEDEKQWKKRAKAEALFLFETFQDELEETKGKALFKMNIDEDGVDELLSYNVDTARLLSDHAIHLGNGLYSFKGYTWDHTTDYLHAI
jgi:hypothetical protein